MHPPAAGCLVLSKMSLKPKNSRVGFAKANLIAPTGRKGRLKKPGIRCGHGFITAVIAGIQ